MNKFKLATKKIVAVGTAVAVASSSALAAFPGMFVEDDKFMADVVVGADAAASDMTAAEALIASLESKYSGDSTQVEIVARMSAEGGDSVSAVDTKETLNFGENLGDVDEELDKDVSDLLEDSDLDNNEYTQELELKNGAFEYRIFDEVDGEDTAKAGLYYDANQIFATYTLDFEDQPDIATTSDKEDLIGQELTIMGNEFTVVEIDEQQITLIGGSNKVALGEAESTTVSVDGKSYEISIQSVSEDEVLITVNGQSVSIDEFDVEEVAGISVAVTDLVDSDRDSVKGYAELVVGGQKVELEDGKTVRINDEDLDDIDMYDAYDVEVTIANNTAGEFESIVIDYKVDDNVVLAAGDSLTDILFDSFALTYDGMNDVEYVDFEITTSNDGVTFNGELFNGEELPSEFELTTDDETNASIYLGSDSERIYFQGSDLTITDLETANSLDAITYSGTVVEFDISADTTDVKDNMFFSYLDDDEFYLYEITSVDKDDLEIDFNDLIDEKETNAVDIDDVQTSLELASSVASNTSGVLNIETANLGTPELYLANELMMNFAAVEEFNFTDGGVTSDLDFSYNSDNIDMDDTAFETDSFRVSIERAADEDDALELSLSRVSGSWVNSDDVEDDSDYEVYVDHYGTMVTLDTEDKDDLVISVPDKEVEAMVSVSFGSGAAQTITRTVSAADVESVKEELIEEGYTIVSENEMSTEDVEFMVEGVTLDVDASSENVIVIGGPAVNEVARELLGIESYDVSQAGVEAGEGVARVFEEENSVLIYGYSAEDTTAIVNEVIAGTANFQ